MGVKTESICSSVGSAGLFSLFLGGGEGGDGCGSLEAGTHDLRRGEEGKRNAIGCSKEEKKPVEASRELSGLINQSVNFF